MKFILFDIEATCWDGYHSNGIQEIIELGALSYNRFGEENGSFIHLVRPEINPRLSQFCKELTGITQQDVDDAAVFENVYQKFEEWVEPDVDTWFVSWGTFDLEILNEACSRTVNDASMIQNHVDLQSKYTQLKSLTPRTSLAKAVEIEEWDFEGSPHRAMPDTRNMAHIFREYIEYWKLG